MEKNQRENTSLQKKCAAFSPQNEAILLPVDHPTCRKSVSSCLKRDLGYPIM
jgi:hypothetical protein